jgi:cell wall assembly regulator SMI1
VDHTVALDLVTRVRHRLTEKERPFATSAPATEDAIADAEDALGCRFPPSYRTFLLHVGGLALPPHMGVVHHFVGISPIADGKGVVEQTLGARHERRLAANLVVVGMGAHFQEWFCLDMNRPGDDGEYPVVLFDARDNAVDQEFYRGFGQMLEEVLGFVEETLAAPLD